jgi:hypothetical protein
MARGALDRVAQKRTGRKFSSVIVGTLLGPEADWQELLIGYNRNLAALSRRTILAIRITDVKLIVCTNKTRIPFKPRRKWIPSCRFSRQPWIESAPGGKKQLSKSLKPRTQEHVDNLVIGRYLDALELRHAVLLGDGNVGEINLPAQYHMAGSVDFKLKCNHVIPEYTGRNSLGTMRANVPGVHLAWNSQRRDHSVELCG